MPLDETKLETLLRRLDALRDVRTSIQEEVKKHRSGPKALAWEHAKAGAQNGIEEAQRLLEESFIKKETFLKIYGKTHEELLTSSDKECRLIAQAAEIVENDMEQDGETGIKDPPCEACSDRTDLKHLVKLLTPLPNPAAADDEPPF
jgi:hypothetical protein